RPWLGAPGSQPRSPLAWFLAICVNALAWTLAICVSLFILQVAWIHNDHLSADFSGQWLMGRMLVHQQGDKMYLVGPQREVLASGYEGEALAKVDHNLIGRKLGAGKSGVEGPLYPPTLGFLMRPFAGLEPKQAHDTLAVVYAALTFFTAWLLRDITQGRL